MKKFMALALALTLALSLAACAGGNGNSGDSTTPSAVWGGSGDSSATPTQSGGKDPGADSDTPGIGGDSGNSGNSGGTNNGGDNPPGTNSTTDGGTIVTDTHREATAKGFPDSGVFAECAFGFTLSPPTVQTKHGYTSSYHYDAIPGDNGTLYIYLFKNYSTAEWGDLSWNNEEYTSIVDEMSQQSGIPLKLSGNEYAGPEPYDSGGKDYPCISIKLVGNYVEIVVDWVRHAG